MQGTKAEGTEELDASPCPTLYPRRSAPALGQSSTHPHDPAHLRARQRVYYLSRRRAHDSLPKSSHPRKDRGEAYTAEAPAEVAER